MIKALNGILKRGAAGGGSPEPSPLTRSNVVFTDSFDTLTVVDTTTHVGWTQIDAANPSNDLQIVTDITRTPGGKSLRVECNSNAPYEGSTTSFRSEIRTDKEGPINLWDMWIGVSIYLPASYINESLANILWQLHATEDDADVGNSPPLAIIVENGWITFHPTYSAAATQTGSDDQYLVLPVMPVQTGVWLDFIIYTKLRWDSTGELKVWVNNSLKLEYYGPNTFNDVLPPYTKMGLYISDWVDGIETATQRVAYFDEYRLGTLSSNYHSVHPDLTAEPTPAALPSSESLVFRDTLPVVEAANATARLGWSQISQTGAAATMLMVPYAGAGSTQAVNAGYNCDAPLGFISANVSGATGRFIYTDAKLLNINNTQRRLSRIRFYTAHGQAGWANIPCVKIGGQWYAYDYATKNTQTVASGTSQANDATAFATHTHTVDITVSDTAIWRALTAAPGAAISVGGTGVALPSGTITAVGLLFENASASNYRLRFDTVELYTTLRS